MKNAQLMSKLEVVNYATVASVVWCAQKDKVLNVTFVNLRGKSQ